MNISELFTNQKKKKKKKEKKNCKENRQSMVVDLRAMVSNAHAQVIDRFE